MSQSAPCGRSLVTPREVVEKVSRSGWMLVKPNTWERFQEHSADRQRRSVSQYGSKYCNWTIEIDDNVERNPRFLSKAVCKGCPFYCKPVYFQHRVLMRDCINMRTKKEKINVWKWETVTLEVAFAYRPWSTRLARSSSSRKKKKNRMRILKNDWILNDN